MSRYYRIYLLTVLLAASLIGCTRRTELAGQLADKPAAPAEEKCLKAGEMDFLDCMAEQPKCTFAQAVRAVVILMNGSDVGTSHEQRCEYLLERGVIRSAWKISPDRWIDRGTLAFMFYKAIGLKGGVNMIVFGSWGLGDRRFAYRELVYRNLMERGVDYNYVSGPELVTALGKVDWYMQDTGRYTPAEKIELGEKPR